MAFVCEFCVEDTERSPVLVIRAEAHWAFRYWLCYVIGNQIGVLDNFHERPYHIFVIYTYWMNDA